MFLIGTALLLPYFFYLNYRALIFFAFKAVTSLQKIKFLFLFLILYADNISSLFISKENNFEYLFKYSNYVVLVLLFILTLIPDESEEVPMNYEELNKNEDMLALSMEPNSITENELKPKGKRNFFTLVTILGIVVCFVFIEYDLFAKLKKLDSKMENPKLIDFINYPIFGLVLYILVRNSLLEIKDQEKIKKKSLFLYFFNFSIVLLMLIFDIRNPKYFTTQDDTQQLLTRAVYLCLSSYVIACALSKKFIINLKIPIFIFLFFVCDVFERILLIFVYFFSVSKFLLKNKVSQNILKIVAFICDFFQKY